MMLSMHEVPRDGGIFRPRVGKEENVKLEFFKFLRVTDIVGYHDGLAKAEIAGETRRTLGATVVGILHGCTIDSA
jgi:hypothetical protein